MAKARPLRNAAGKPRAKVAKAPDRPVASGKTAVARPAVARARLAMPSAPAGHAAPAARPPAPMPEPVAPPPLPAPIASFTF
jgi:hypothetical protein